MTWIILFAIVLIIVILVLKPYFIRYDTVIAFTGGLGTGKSYISTLTAVRQLRKNRIKTAVYNIIARLYNFLFRRTKNFERRELLKKPLLYSSIPIKISKKEMSVVLTPEMLTLQEAFIKGSIVFIDEVDVFASQYSYANSNIIETSNKKDIEKMRLDELFNGSSEYDSGLFDEEIRLFRHLYSSDACECKLIVNSQATSNIALVIRRRMNTVFVLSCFRIYKIPFVHLLPVVGWLFEFYKVDIRNITITDEITNTSEGHAEDACSKLYGWLPRHKLYDTHCYRHRADTIPVPEPSLWRRLTTERLLKAPVRRLKNKSKTEQP